jgi:exosome complex RNA-binding protein Csl4
MEKCDKCNSDLKHDEGHDTIYCPKCDEWKESKCSDKECFYCSNRPEKPSMAR